MRIKCALVFLTLMVPCASRAAELVFPIAVGDDDIAAHGMGGATYAPAYSSCNPDHRTITIQKTLATSYTTRMALLQFDTSSLPDTATVTGAALRLAIGATVRSVDARSFVADWFNWGGTCDAADYTNAGGNNAHAGTLISSIAPNLPRDFVLQNLSNISRTGVTRLRLQVSGGQPTGDNSLQFGTFEEPTLTAARLVVAFTTNSPPTASPRQTLTATRTLRPVATSTRVPTGTGPTRTPTPTSTPASLQSPTAGNTPSCAACTLWIGFSQVAQSGDVNGNGAGFFKAWETTNTNVCLVNPSKPRHLSNAQTEARWCLGCGLERWAIGEGRTINGASSAWDASCTGQGQTSPGCLYSACSARATTPERIVFVVTDALVAPDLLNPDQYQPYLNGAIALIRSHYPSATQIILDSVVGGPGGSLCYCDASNNCSATGGAGRTVVRASHNYPIIVEAIDEWIASHPGAKDVIRGPMPTVPACSDYTDPTGHLTGWRRSNGGCRVAARVAQLYEPMGAGPCAP